MPVLRGAHLLSADPA